MFGMTKKLDIPSKADALPGRPEAILTDENHFVSGNPLKPPFPSGMEVAVFGMGCFWGVERIFWGLEGVWVTSVGYLGGHSPNATYEEVCSGRTGHNEVVQVVYDPTILPYDKLLQVFWEGHDPTQGMKQGNDRGTQYRSGIYCFDDAQIKAAEASRDVFQAQLTKSGFGEVTTEILSAGPYYYAEGYHQQYLAKNPAGYCGIGGTGVTCPIGLT